MSNTSMKNHDRKASYSSLAALVRSGLESQFGANYLPSLAKCALSLSPYVHDVIHLFTHLSWIGLDNQGNALISLVSL